jgi:hypothetical protein
MTNTPHFSFAEVPEAIVKTTRSGHQVNLLIQFREELANLFHDEQLEYPQQSNIEMN